MDSSELVIRLREFLARQSEASLRRQALIASFNLREMVRYRVQNTGIGPDGRPFAPYVPSYARERQKAGFQIRKVDYTRTGSLWGSIIPEVESNGPGFVVIAIGPTTEDNAVKLRGPGTLTPRKDGVRRGLPTLPSPDELRETMDVWAEEIIDEFLKTVNR